MDRLTFKVEIKGSEHAEKVPGPAHLQLLCYLDHQLVHSLGLSPTESMALVPGKGKVPRVCFQVGFVLLDCHLLLFLEKK